MEEEFKISEEQKELIDIITSIVSTSKIIDNEKVKIPFEDALKKLKAFKVEDKDKDLEHLVFFVKNLFTDKNGNLDFDFVKLKKMLSEDAVKAIFCSLIECIESKSFLDFLLELGEIFSKIYFKLKNFHTQIEKYENKGINNYEILFHIFTKCKKSQINNYISKNYDTYYFEAYSMSLSYDLIKANNAYIELIIASPNFDNISDFISEEDNTTDSSINKANKIIDIEAYIYESLVSFLCNSQFLYSADLHDFVLIFFDFITQDGTKNFILNNKMNNDMKIYLEYMSFYLEKLFKDFTEDSLYEFKLSLFQFVESHKNDKIKFVERAFSIGESYNLSKEQIGIISMLCSNHKYIEKMEKLAQEKAQQISNYDEGELEKIQMQNRLSNEELLILVHIFDEQKKPNSEITNKTNDDNCKADENKINQEKEANQVCQAKNQISLSDTELTKHIFDVDPKYQQLLSMINNMKDQYSKDKEQYNKEISSLNKQIKDLNQKYQNDISNMKKENSKLNQKIETLNDVHRLIYFRDVSKYYIRNFAQTYKIGGESTYHICQNILSKDFSKSNAKHLKKIIIKIATHYLNGNKFAHMEFFISKSKSIIKSEVEKEIENSYIEFMKFNPEEKNKLIKEFKIKNAPFIYNHKFK